MLKLIDTIVLTHRLFYYNSSIRFHRFFFQAEDGIRDDLVTGVQTCALPIFGGAAAVDAIAFLLHRPRAEAGAPLLVLAADDIAVAIEEDGRALRVFDQLGDQEWAALPFWIGEDFAGHAEAR